jgi:hypothetical protein
MSYSAVFSLLAAQGSATVSVGSNTFSNAAGHYNQDGFDADNTISIGLNSPAPELNLGQVLGRTLHLMHPYVSSSGKVYYVGDLNNNGVIDVQNHGDLGDHANHVWLDNVFNNGADRYDTQGSGAVAGIDDARTLLLDGLTLVNPTTKEIEALRLDFNFNPPPGWDFVDAPPTFGENVATSTLVATNVHQNIGIENSANYTNLYDGYYNGLFVVQVLGEQLKNQPMVSLTSNKNNLVNGEAASITFVLDQISTDFSASDVTVMGGTLSNFQGSGTNYSATFTPNAGVTSAGLFVASNKFSDAAGNMNADGADADNALILSVQPVTFIALPSTSSVLMSMPVADPIDTHSINLSNVLSMGTSLSNNQKMLKIDGNANDVVNLSNLLDSGQNTGTWQPNMSIQLDQQSYKYWTHSGNQNAVLLVEDSIQTVNLM